MAKTVTIGDPDADGRRPVFFRVAGAIGGWKHVGWLMPPIV